MENLIDIKQFPILEERAHMAQKEVEERIFFASSLICTENTVKAVKENRSENRKALESIKRQIKDVEEALLAPFSPIKEYCQKELIAPLEALDERQKRDISDVEGGIIKARCEDGLRDYFAELCAVHHLDWLSYEQAGVKVDMASAKAKTPKKLREQLSAFVAGVAESVDRINILEDAGEIMVEYQKTLDAAGAICTVKERHRRIEEQKKLQEARNAIRAQEAEVVRRVEALALPVVVQKPEKNPDDILESFTYTVFNVKRSQLWEIREFLKERGIKYE